MAENEKTVRTGRVIQIPDPSLVMLVGTSSSGKTTFAQRHFAPSEILASDTMRTMVADDERNDAVSSAAFEALFAIARKRLELRHLTVIDATSLARDAQDDLRALARECHAMLCAIVLDVDPATVRERNRTRPEGERIDEAGLNRQIATMRRAKKHAKSVARHRCTLIEGTDAISSTTIARVPLQCDRRALEGPFDIIGDVHGCLTELLALLAKLGYEVDINDATWTMHHSEGRTAVFVGDLVDRGPSSVECLELAIHTVREGSALIVEGNHEARLARALGGGRTSTGHGLEETLEAIAKLKEPRQEALRRSLKDLPSHIVLAGGALAVAHAGLKAEMILGTGSAVRGFARYGETTGECDSFGLPVRTDWGRHYKGKCDIVYGHTPSRETSWTGRTLCVDTGCVFGGALSALRWPEREIVSVPANRTWCEPTKPLDDAPEREADDLYLDDVTGTRRIETGLGGSIRINAPKSAAAIDIATRFGIDPRWLAYLPATMAPSHTRDGVTSELERPEQAFDEYRAAGVSEVVCELKHMGSRAIVIAARNAETLERVFGPRGAGVVYTRTSRRFFDNEGEERQIIDAVSDAMSATGTWEAIGSDWIMLDGELVPWVTKARGLIEDHYQGPGLAGRIATEATLNALNQHAARTAGGDENARSAIARTRARCEAVARFNNMIEHYQGTDPKARFAPFAVLASEGKVWAKDVGRPAQLELLGALASSNDTLVATESRRIRLDDAQACAAGAKWWESMTQPPAHEEGMVVKPIEACTKEQLRARVQPALKVRGAQYLHIIYGPEYSIPENLERLRRRASGAKRALAIREHAIGVEGLERLVAGAPLHRRYECALAVLALESEPTDPRL